MRDLNAKQIAKLQKNVSNVKNVCILAHVDHGKTTLADSLIASNGIISQRMAGKLRYLDSRRDEQERGITMKSSSISLVYQKEHDKENDAYLINLIDSPGHVDFSGEVSTAIRLCDGAIIIVDVIEGVCSQTKASLHQAWIEGLKPVLVLNKIDRLFMERKLTPLDAFIQLQQTLEQINAFLGELITCDILGKCDSEKTSDLNDDKVSENRTSEAYNNWSSGMEEYDDSSIYFSPELGNVVFACALDSWGFSINTFSSFLSKKQGFSEDILRKTLWGDFYLNSKEKKIMKGANSKAKKPLFVTMVLENICSVYESIINRRDKVSIEKIANTLGVQLKSRDLNHSEPRSLLKTVMSQWLPLSDALLEVVSRVIPSPNQLTEDRIERLMCSNTRSFVSFPNETKAMKKDLLECSPSRDAPIVICVSKMFSIEKQFLPQFKARPMTAELIAERRNQMIQQKIEDEKVNETKSTDLVEKIDTNNIVIENEYETENNNVNESVFIAFARIFSGTVKTGDKVFILGPKYNPSKITSENNIDPNLTLEDLSSNQHVTVTHINQLYLLMGRELESIDEISAGNIFGIGGLEKHILKSATISNSLYFPPFIDLHLSATPILRVALEPQNLSEMPKLIHGLKLLNQADPCVEVKLQDSGEHIIVTTGEVHLQRCIDDLVQQFAGIEINYSSPIVPFRETIVHSNEKADQKNSFEMFTPNKMCKIRMIAKPLPESVCELLSHNKQLMKVMTQHQRESTMQSKTQQASEEFSNQIVNGIISFKSKLITAFKEAEWEEGITDKIWSFGPKYSGTNILINFIPDYIQPNIWDINRENSTSDAVEKSSSIDDNDKTIDLRSDFDHSFVSGFQLATIAGPLAEEPLTGVCFVIEEWSFVNDGRLIPNDPYGPFSGQIMSTVKESCRKSFQLQPQRLMAAMYSSNIQVNTEALGKMYAVLGRRHGRVLHGDIQEGSQTFTITAVLPVIESFEFANEIRKQTSGKASPQLVFSHWEVIDIDPFWVPTTLEEYELYGEKADTENRARKYMNSIRKRKGLAVDEKIVEHAEKQRTLTRNK